MSSEIEEDRHIAFETWVESLDKELLTTKIIKILIEQRRDAIRDQGHDFWWGGVEQSYNQDLQILVERNQKLMSIKPDECHNDFLSLKKELAEFSNLFLEFDKAMKDLSDDIKESLKSFIEKYELELPEDILEYPSISARLAVIKKEFNLKLSKVLSSEELAIYRDLCKE